MTTVDELFSLNARQAEVFRLVKNGGLSVKEALEGTQRILDKTYPVVPYHGPTWYVSPEEQIVRTVDLFLEHPEWGYSAGIIPPVPTGFVQATPTEVLMLAVYLPKKGRAGGVQRTFDELSGCIQAPVGFTKYRWPDLKSDIEQLRLLNGRKHRPGVRWVAFDPFANWDPQNGRKVEDLWATRGNNLAASESFDALRLFPELLNGMDGKKFPYFDLAGYQFFWDKAWTRCPYFRRWVGDRQVKLGADWADYSDRHFSAPSVREF